jgi:5'-nucleotidase/UDP-sugar diphosphatase
VMAALQNTCDYIILLSHSGLNKDRELAKEFPGINLIIGGHSQDHLTEPVKVGNALIVQAGESGYYQGVLQLLFKNKKVSSYNDQLVLLDSHIKNDPEILKIISEYRNERDEYILKNRRIR